MTAPIKRRLVLTGFIVVTAGCNTGEVMNSVEGDYHAVCNWREIRYDFTTDDWVTWDHNNVESRVWITTSGGRYMVSVTGRVFDPPNDFEHPRVLSLTSLFNGGDSMPVSALPGGETADRLAYSANWVYGNLDCPNENDVKCTAIRWPGRLAFTKLKKGSGPTLLTEISGWTDRDLDPADDFRMRAYACRVSNPSP